MEFWATWCSPCVSALPHLNQLAEEFQNEDVLFLAISEDDPKRLEGFLAGQSVRAIIGIDADRKTWNAFDVPSIPHTVIIDAKGRLIGATTPEQLSAERLRRVLAGETAKFPPKEGIRCDLQWDEDSIEWQDGIRPTTYAIIKPIKTTMGGYLPQPGHLTADGLSFRSRIRPIPSTSNGTCPGTTGPTGLPFAFRQGGSSDSSPSFGRRWRIPSASMHAGRNDCLPFVCCVASKEAPSCLSRRVMRS